MAIVCDLCNKGPRTRGPGKEMFIARWALPSSDGFSIHFEPMETAYYGRGGDTHAICGACLAKLGVPAMLAEHEEYERRMERKREVDVTPRQIEGRRPRQITAG